MDLHRSAVEFGRVVSSRHAWGYALCDSFIKYGDFAFLILAPYFSAQDVKLSIVKILDKKYFVTHHLRTQHRTSKLLRLIAGTGLRPRLLVRSSDIFGGSLCE